MYSKQTFYVGGRHKSTTVDIFGYEKRNPERKKNMVVWKGKVIICGRNKSHFLLSNWINILNLNPNRTKEKIFKNLQNCKNNHFSTMSTFSWYDLKNKGSLPKILNLFPNSKCECQKQITFASNQCQLEGARFKSTMKKHFKVVKNRGICLLSQQ